MSRSNSAKSHKKHCKIAISGLNSIFSTDLELSASRSRTEWSHKCLLCVVPDLEAYMRGSQTMT